MKQLLSFIIITITAISHSQNTKQMKQENPLLCDPQKGACEVPIKDTSTQEPLDNTSKTLRIVYYTDPICSSCWGIEPQLRKMKLEYGHEISIEYRMGGLLPDWSYNSGGISKPSDVAHHWDEVSSYYNMPIDGDIWLEDPLSSSYPPSIAFKAAEIQDAEKAIKFMRIIREMVFLQKKNITRWEHIEQAAKQSGLDINQFKHDVENQAKLLFNEDLSLAKQLGVRGFPTLFFIDSTGKTERVYGSQPYSAFEKAIKSLHPNALKQSYSNEWKTLFTTFNSLTLREFSELSGATLNDSKQMLDQLTKQEQLIKYDTKNGSIWYLGKE
jgi:predicted DsbA family dithiol-disulfide isomerase